MLSDQEKQKRLSDVAGLIEMMRPAVQADGGDLILVSADPDTGIIEVALQGSCSSCAISSSTLQLGVERILKGRLDWVNEVKGGVDDSLTFEDSYMLGKGGYVPAGR